jgi:sugar O-acyltransferase (sialic acid O-acetyltransferase NeuD family)
VQGDLLIVGTGGSSREVAEAVEDINRVSETWNLLGFLDDNSSLEGLLVHGYPVIGATRSIQRFPKAYVFIGVANDRNRFIRKQIAERLKIEKQRFPTLIHPTACVSKRAELGCGTVILQFSFISGNVLVGDHVIISQSAVISHDVTIGSYVSMSTCLSVAGGVKIGDGVYIGSGARIYPRIEIGDGALIGIGAVVFNGVPPEVTVFSNPGRVLPSKQ